MVGGEAKEINSLPENGKALVVYGLWSGVQTLMSDDHTVFLSNSSSEEE